MFDFWSDSSSSSILRVSNREGSAFPCKGQSRGNSCLVCKKAPDKVFRDFHPFWIFPSYTRGCTTTSCLTSGLRRLERNRTFLDRKCAYFSVKLIKLLTFKLKYDRRRQSMQEKESIMVVRCELKIPSIGITVRHHSASLVMPNNYPRDGIFNPLFTNIKDSYIHAYPTGISVNPTWARKCHHFDVIFRQTFRRQSLI